MRHFPFIPCPRLRSDMMSAAGKKYCHILLPNAQSIMLRTLNIARREKWARFCSFSISRLGFSDRQRKNFPYNGRSVGPGLDFLESCFHLYVLSKAEHVPDIKNWMTDLSYVRATWFTKKKIIFAASNNSKKKFCLSKYFKQITAIMWIFIPLILAKNVIYIINEW